MSWKDNPVVVGAGAVAVTLGITSTFYEQSIIPTRIASVGYDLLRSKQSEADIQTKLSQEESRTANLKQSYSLLEKNVTELKKEIGTLSSELVSERNSNSFIYGSPYPKGFGEIKVGDKLSLVFKKYKKDEIDNSNDGYIVVEQNNDFIFNRATYYFDVELDDKKITHILFYTNHRVKVSAGFLDKTLSEVLGSPFQFSKEGYFGWFKTDFSVYKDDEDSYLVMESGYYPGSWPKKLNEEIAKIGNNACGI